MFFVPGLISESQSASLTYYLALLLLLLLPPLLLQVRVKFTGKSDTAPLRACLGSCVKVQKRSCATVESPPRVY